MPMTIRTKDDHLKGILTNLLAGSIITDVSNPSATRQLAEGTAAELSQLGLARYDDLLASRISSATGQDLDDLMADRGTQRDQGQVASDPVTFTRAQTWLEDIPLPAPQVLQATLADGTAILYRSIGDAVLQPQGRSISGQAPAGSLVGGSTDQLRVNLDGDGARTLTLGTQTTAAAIATALQTAVRALTAITSGNQPAYTGFRCDYSVITAGALTLRSGSTGPTSSVVVTPSTTNDATQVLKLGLAQGGQESPGEDTIDIPVLCDSLGVVGNVGAGQIRTQITPVVGIQSVANALMLSNGREPASDDASRQDLQNYIKSLAGSNAYAIEQAVLNTIGSDGLRHVMTAQVLEGAGHIQAYICDGRSLSMGAQADVLQDVQDELEGLGQRIGGWLPAGVTDGVIPATVRTVDLAPLILVGATVDLVLAQHAATHALYALVYRWPVGASLSVLQVDQRLHDTLSDMLSVTYAATPPEFTANPTRVIGGILGEKLMPGSIAPLVQRA